MSAPRPASRILGFVRSNPFRFGAGEGLQDLTDQHVGVSVTADGGQIGSPDEPLLCRLGKQRQEWIEKALDVQDPAPLAMQAELCPRDHLAQLFECPEAARK